MIRSPLWLLAPVLIATACQRPSDRAESWTCPMHPQYVSDKAGDCPICGMKLVKTAHSEHADASPSQRRVLGYRSPMDPRQTSPVPKKDAMGMDYMPVYADDARAPAMPGYAGVVLSAEQQRVMGLRSIAVVRGELPGEIRTTGRVAIDESRVRQVTTRVQGYVERLQADFTGKLVDKGDPLLSIYSPELLATEEEYLLARRSKDALAQAGLPDMMESARARLRLLGVPEGEIADLDRRGTARPSLTLIAPVSGYLLKKDVLAGGKVGPDQPLFSIVDLSRVWVLADVYEAELSRVRVGQSAQVSAASMPGRIWRGKVTFIEPTLDDKTRTVKVRVAVDNPKMELKPDQFVDVALATPTRSALLVPDDAVIDTGTRKLVFVLLAGERIEPREIEVGLHAAGRYELVAGLKEGERVAAGASFLVDSESRLKAAVQQLAPPPLDGGHP